MSIQFTDKATYSLRDTGIVAPFPARDDKVFCKSSRPVLTLRQPRIQTVPGDLSDSSVGIATRCRLDGTGIDSWWGARFPAPVQTASNAHPASYTVGTGSLPGVKRPGRGVDHPPPSSAEVKERVELYLYSPFGPSLPVLG